MNFNFDRKKPLLQLFLLPIIGAVLATVPLPAMAQNNTSGYTVYEPNFYRDDTNACPFTLTNGQAITFPANGTNSLELTVRQDTGLSLFVTVISSNSLATVEKLGFDTTADGALYTTTQPISFTVPAAAAVTGTLTTNRFWTNYPASYLNNVRSIQLTTATNGLVGGGPTTNSVTTYIRYSYANY